MASDHFKAKDDRVLEVLKRILEKARNARARLAEITGEDIGPSDIEEP